MLTRARRLAALAAAVALAPGLAGCGSGGGEPSADTSSSSSPSPSVAQSPSAKPSVDPTAYLPVPEGVELTAAGTALGLGDEAVVAVQRRQDEVVVLGVAVQRIERTSFQASFPGWTVDDATAARTPYFVRVRVSNVGDVDLGGLRFDNVLWADDGTTLEAPNYYSADQLKACPGGTLPEEFPVGAEAELCQVYFVAPGRELVSIVFPPYGGLDPIVWTGELSKVGKPGRTATPTPTASPTGSPTGSPSGSPTVSPAAVASTGASQDPS